jgi:hypothetical protein
MLSTMPHTSCPCSCKNPNLVARLTLHAITEGREDKSKGYMLLKTRQVLRNHIVLFIQTLWILPMSMKEKRPYELKRLIRNVIMNEF